MNSARTKPRKISGILLHPTSLPTQWGIGDFGPSAHAFLDWLAACGQHLWQILPLGPTGLGDSPYGALSAFAGNPLLISPELLQREKLVELRGSRSEPAGPVEYGSVMRWKDELFDHAWQRATELGLWKRELERFEEKESAWLDEWALFAALRERWPDRAWTGWPEEIRNREPAALAKAAEQLESRVRRHRFVQFVFDRQWQALRQHAASLHITIMGDLPIYVAGDGADVWSNPDKFLLDRQRMPTHVAGVPPDYFSPTGQRWGNPLYDWDAMKAEKFSWWIARMRANLRLTDLVRLDHFRGFAGYWAVPAEEETAVHGEWRTGPGEPLFKAMRAELGELPIVAEDLGTITPDVELLREAIDVPGMKVLQFAFGEDDSPHMLHEHTPDTVAYTGTHDNDTTVGWWRNAADHEKDRVRSVFGPVADREPHWTLLRAAWSSVGNHAVAPFQDLFGLGSEARMNTPGAAEGNWRWRFRPQLLADAGVAKGLRRLTEITGRSDATRK